MGRWGVGIYESDTALDYFSEITALLEREIAYWFAPEHVNNSGWWLAQVFTVVELVCLLDQVDSASTVFLAVENPSRWRETILGVWDGDWENMSQEFFRPYHPCDTFEYRMQNRPSIVAMFEYLEATVHFWQILSKSDLKPVQSVLQLPHPLPYFSIQRSTDQKNHETASVERFIHKLIGYLVREIIYWLSQEKRTEVLTFGSEEVWVSVDLLGFLCERYEQSPCVNVKKVRVWQETINEVEKSFLEGQGVWDETNPVYRNVLQAFERLERVAEKYPPPLDFLEDSMD
jgi:hypothetical protein